VRVSSAAISAEDLAKCFGDVVALDGVSLEVPRGSVLGLLGPNGAGKTTVVRILTTLLHPDRGRASVLGIGVAEDPARVRSMIGLAGQYAAVDENLTGRENLRLMGRLTHMEPRTIASRSDDLLGLFDLTEAANRPVRTYSGGMRRRIDLAAALVHQPPVLFLDEPTTGLDPRSRTDLWGVIEDLVRDGTTVLLTTQYLEEADRLADNMVIIDGGHVIAEGTAGALKARLGASIIEIGTHDPATATAVAGILDGMGRIELEGTTAALVVDDGSSVLMEVVRRLDAARVAPTTLALREPTLDDVFLTLTGHGAVAAAPDPPPTARRGGSGKAAP